MTAKKEEKEEVTLPHVSDEDAGDRNADGSKKADKVKNVREEKK